MGTRPGCFLRNTLSQTVRAGLLAERRDFPNGPRLLARSNGICGSYLPNYSDRIAQDSHLIPLFSFPIPAEARRKALRTRY